MSTEYYFRDALEGALNMTMNGATFTSGDGAEILDYCRAHPDEVTAAQIAEALQSYGRM